MGVGRSEQQQTVQTLHPTHVCRWGQVHSKFCCPGKTVTPDQRVQILCHKCSELFPGKLSPQCELQTHSALDWVCRSLELQ